MTSWEVGEGRAETEAPWEGGPWEGDGWAEEEGCVTQAAAEGAVRSGWAAAVDIPP